MYKLKPLFHPTLFINHKLIKNKKQLAVVIGDYFEELTAKTLNVDRLGLTSREEVVPDLRSKDGSKYIESKASNLKTSGGVAIRKSQLNYYANLATKEVKCFYCLWFYDLDLDTLNTDKIEEIRPLLGTAVKTGIIFDLDTIKYFLKESKSENIVRLKHKNLLRFIYSIDYNYVDRRKLIQNVYDHDTCKFTLFKVT